jgi:NitT/TauT family transport system ATP-binding protein
VSLDGVGLSYPNGTRALERVSLSVDEGEFVSVVGPSGCGKSTLLRLAAGLLAPTDGAVRRDSDRVGFVFQDATLLPWRTVRRNVELVGELTGLPRSERIARAIEALRRVGLSDVADQRPGTLSGGMRMRVSLARALSARPSLYLFDEPFAGVDELTRARLGEDLQALFAADRFTALLVTHSVAEAVYLSGRVVVLSRRPGRVLGEVAVPAPYPRTPELRYTAEVAELAARVTAMLRADARGDEDRSGEFRRTAEPEPAASGPASGDRSQPEPVREASP